MSPIRERERGENAHWKVKEKEKEKWILNLDLQNPYTGISHENNISY